MVQFSENTPSHDRGPPVSPFAALASSDAATQADRIAAETLIRSTVQVLASGSAIRDLDSLVQRNVGNISQADIRAGRLGSNVLGDIISTVEQAKGNAAINWHAATPQQIAAYLAANGFNAASANRLMGASPIAADEKPNSGDYTRGLATSADSSFLKSVDLNDATGKALAAMGFATPEQVRQVVHDANTLGLAPSTAALDLGRLRKAEGARTDQHVAALKQYGDDLSALSAEKREIEKISDPKERAERMRLHEEKVRQREEKLNAYRDGNVRTPDGRKSFERVRDKLRKENNKKVELDGPAQANFGETYNGRIADVERLAAMPQVEANHGATVAEIAAAPSVSDDIKARLARTAQAKAEDDTPAPASSVAQPGAAKTASATQVTKSETAKPAAEPKAPEQRQAVNTKALKLTV